MIFVFGSNTGGRHGKGAAYTALKSHGAIYGQGQGIQGESYALPTCDKNFRPLPLIAIQFNVERFLGYAMGDSKLKYKVTRIGCGLGGYQDKDIAPMFKHAPQNVFFDEQWRPYLGEDHEYWGTY
jgi:hypothetical protein